MAALFATFSKSVAEAVRLEKIQLPTHHVQSLSLRFEKTSETTKSTPPPPCPPCPSPSATLLWPSNTSKDRDPPAHRTACVSACPAAFPVGSPDGTAHLKSAVFRCLHASHQLLGTISPCSLLVLAPRAAIPAAVPALPRAGLVERLPPCSSTGPSQHCPVHTGGCSSQHRAPGQQQAGPCDPVHSRPPPSFFYIKRATAKLSRDATFTSCWVT